MISNRRMRQKTVRVVSKCLISMALMTSVLTVGLESAAHASAPIAEAATFPVSTSGPGATMLTVNPQKLGDLVVFESQLHSQSITVTGVNCPGTGTWTLAKRYVDTTNGPITEEIWWAMATSTGPTTITASYSSSITGVTNELVSDSFTSASPSVWSSVLGAGNAATSTGAITFPSVTSGAGTNQLYWGYAQSTGTAAIGSTLGFNYSLTGAGNLVTYNDALSPSTPYAPTATESPNTSNNTSIAAIFLATPATAYTVTFEGNGSTGGSMSTETTTIATPLTANAFTRAGYTFSGWNTVAGGGGTAYADGASYPFTASTTLYAQWALTPATLTAVGNFASNAGTGLTTANASLTQAGDLLVIWVKALDPTTSIHVTSIAASGSGTGTIGTPVKAIQYDTVDHANNDDEIWYAPVTHAGTITLTFTWSGSNSSDVSQYSTQEFQPSTASTYSLDTTGHYENITPTLTMQFPPLTPVGAGELYAGYNSNDTTVPYSGTTTGYTANTLADGDVILFNPDVSASTQSPSTTATGGASTQSSIGALFIATPNTPYTVTFNANLGSGTMANETDNTPTPLTANAFTRTGYTFAGWNTAANGIGGTAYADGASYPFTASTTLYAQWTAAAPDYTVTFSANLGSGTMANETDNTPTPLTPNAFTRAGYTFAGWNTAANGGGTSYADGAIYSFTASTTLYAQWTVPVVVTPPASYTVTFNGNGSTGGSMSPETDSAATALTANAFTRTGYTFSGWNTVATGTGGTPYADGASYPFTASATLFAQWTAIPTYTVTFNGNGATGGSMGPETDSTATGLTANAFTRAGYTFSGWNTVATGSGTAYADGASYSFTASTTLYAQWAAVAPHASSVVGGVVVGGSRVLAIIGTGFVGKLRVITNGPGATVHVLHASATRILLWVRVNKTSRPGRHTFTIITVSGQKCTISYLTK